MKYIIREKGKKRGKDFTNNPLNLSVKLIIIKILWGSVNFRKFRKEAYFDI